MDIQENFEHVFVMKNVAMNKLILKIDHFKYFPKPQTFCGWDFYII